MNSPIIVSSPLSEINPTTTATTEISILPSTSITTTNNLSSFTAPSPLTVVLPPQPSPLISPSIPATSTSTSTLKRTNPFEIPIVQETNNKYLNENSQEFKAAKSAMEWNKLLTWARKTRGPQWDWGTSQYQVDCNSAEYYSGVPRIIDPEADALALQQQQHYNSSGNGGMGTPIQMNRQIPFNTGGNSQSGSRSEVYDSGRPKRTRAAMGGR